MKNITLTNPRIENNLNLQNFWNGLLVICPKSVPIFCTWIDKYKEEVGWSYMFGNHRFEDPDQKTKFHNVPLDMQVGIILRFLYDSGMSVGMPSHQMAIYGYDHIRIAEFFRKAFIMMEESIAKGKGPIPEYPIVKKAGL